VKQRFAVLLPLSYWNASRPAMVRLYLIPNDCLGRPAVHQQYKRTIVEHGGPSQHSRWGDTMTTPRHTTLAKLSGRDRIPSTTHKSERTRSIKQLKALVVVDSTDASKRVLRYLEQLATAGDQPEFHLAYVASRVPAELLETGGAESPDREEQVQSNLRRQQRAWMAGTDKKAWRILRAAQADLLRAGVKESRIHACVSSPLDAREAADEVLLLARDHDCDTVIVGQTPQSWLGALSGGGIADQLVRRAKGYAVWVIG
jgi:nucleotide-binding universal stress UspA family protein